MNDRRYSIFISSTFRDLEDHREKVIREVNKAGHLPICMEFFNPDFRRSEEYIREKIDECDIFVVILGVVSGSPIDSGLAFTEFEYNYAVSKKKKIIRFLCETKDFRKNEPKKELIDFREKVENDGTISGWFSLNSADSTAAAFSASMRSTVDQIERERPSGWIRSEEYDLLVKLRHLSVNSSNSLLATFLIDRIEENQIALAHASYDLDEKQDIARFFWRMAFAGLFEDSEIRNIFFEASSSAAFMNSRLLDLVNENPFYSTVIKDDVNFGTNCLFSSLTWKLQPIDSRFPVERTSAIPDTPFSREYAAAFGPIQNTISINATSFSRGGFALRSDAKVAVEETTSILNEFLENRKGLAFMSLTGLALSEEGYQGGFVNSYKNCLFKRALIRSNSPKVFIIDGRKWDASFDEESQYPIFTDDLSWDSFTQKEPVCFVMSTKIPQKLTKMLKYFRGLGFHKPLSSKIDDNHLLIVFNDPFKDIVRII